MPAPLYEIANGDIMLVSIFSSYQGQRIMNVAHYEAESLPAPITDGASEMDAQLLNVKDFLLEWGVANWKDYVVDTYQFEYIQCQIIYPERRYYAWTDYFEAGAIAADGVPSNVGGNIHFQSSRVGRGRAGSKHITGLPLTALEGNQLTVGTRNNLLALGTQFMQDLPIGGGGNFTPVLWTPTAPTVKSYPVVRTVPNEVRIMRRRTLRIGE